MPLHRASQHRLHGQQSENSISIQLAAGPRRLTVVRPRWGCHGRALHIRCGHVRSSSGGSSAAACVRTAVAAFDAHQLTCEAGSSSSSVQDLLLVVRDEHRARQQRQQEQELQHAADEQQLQQPQHLALLEVLQAQPLYAQVTRSRGQQQQHAQARPPQQHQQHVPPQQEHAQLAHLKQQQQQLELHMLEQQRLRHWDVPQQQQLSEQHHVLPQVQQVDVMDPPVVQWPADAAQQQQAPKQQQRQMDQAAVSSSSSSSGRIAVASDYGNSQQSAAPALPTVTVAQQAVAGVEPCRKAKSKQRQRRQHQKRQQQQEQQSGILGLWNTQGWTRAEVVQGWRFSAAENIARTPLGHAMVRTNSGSQPHSLAAQLLRWLGTEHCAVLSAAGAGRTLTALQAASELQQQLEQQQVTLLVTPHVRSSRRPEGGRCTVYSLHCQIVPAGEAAAAAAPEQPAVQKQATAAPGPFLQAQDGQVQQQQQQQPEGQPSEHWQRQQHEDHLSSPHWEQQQQQLQLASTQQNGRQRHLPDVQQQQQQHWQHEHLQVEHHQQLIGQYMPVSGMLQLADAIEQQQQHQHQRVNGTSSQVQQLHWQQHGLELRLPPQHITGYSSSHQQPCAVLQQQQQQQQCQHDNWLSHAGAGSSQPAAAAAAVPDGVLELEVRGSTAALSEQLELALQRHAAVVMPVVYDKQASKLLEAAAQLNKRWQQQEQQPHHMFSSSSSEAMSDVSSAALGGCSGCSSGLQVVLQLQEAWVQRQSGPRPGLHVYMFAVPSVQ